MDYTVKSLSNMQTGGGGAKNPEIGFAITKWDEETGTPLEVQTFGYTGNPSSRIGLGNVKKYKFNKGITFDTSAKMFQGNTKVEEIDLSEVDDKSLYMPDDFFSGCTKLKTLDMDKFSGNINYNTFKGCTNLDLDHLPDDCSHIRCTAFQNCKNLSSLKRLPDSVRKIGEVGYGGSAFQNCTNLALEELPPNLSKFEGGSNFANCTSLTISRLPNAMTTNTIPAGTFSGCNSITTMDFNNATYIQGFNNCLGLKTVKGHKATTIGAGAFSKSTALVSGSFELVTTINSSSATYGAFTDCTGLKALWVGPITSIGQYAFNGCTSLSKVYINQSRANVEALTDYSTRFSNSTVPETCEFICNDDEGFITVKQFEAIDWATYTG